MFSPIFLSPTLVGGKENWKAKKNKSGYKTFKEDGKHIFVHRRVAEKKVGGKIYKCFEVHYRGGGKDNNRPDNLAVLKMGGL